MREAEIVIQNGSVIDGTGAPRRLADVGVSGDRIVAIGQVQRIARAQVIDAKGMAVAPGFIDVHTHDDRALLASPDMPAKVSQGVTTVVVGNCGVSLAPLAPKSPPPPPLDLIGDMAAYRYPTLGAYLDRLDRSPTAVNAACLVGHSTLRVGAMDRLDRPATLAEIATMRATLARALDDGAIGLSTGLAYAPAKAAPTSEVMSLTEPLREAGAIHTTHMRDEGEHGMESLDETFAIGRHAGVPVVISHHKASGRKNFGRSRESLAAIEAAMRSQPVGLDAYPYVASSTVLDPEWVAEADRVLVTWSIPHPDQAGRDLADIAAEWRISIEEAARRLQPAGAVYFSMDEADVRRILSYAHTMIGSDGLPHDSHPHPRLWGSFPRVLGHYCREVGLFSLEEAVRRMTGLSAQRFGLTNRGRIAIGAYADLVIFDPDRVIDRATFAAPMTPADGIALVMVNGEIVWRDGKSTGSRPGRALRRQQLQAEASRRP
jgi:N-acyl-D-amino-acid deacylase